MSGPHPAASGPDSPRGPAAVMFAADQASRSVGMELVHAGPGTAVVRMRIAMQMLNGHAIAHGGYVFMLADTAFACACNSEGPVTEGDVLTATATTRARYGRSGIYDVTVRRGDDIIAEFRGRSRTVG
jgi:acyl-CoA thioesterase